MFMIDMQGTRDFATASSSSRTPGERYCGSCMREPDEIVVGRIDVAGTGGGHLAGQLARVEHDRILAALDRQAHAEALGVDQVGLGRAGRRDAS